MSVFEMNRAGRTATAIALVVLSIFALAASSLAEEGATLKLIAFTPDVIQKRIAASCAQVTLNCRADLPGGAIDVRIAPGKENYPGIAIKPETDVWDLSKFGHVEARIVNTGDKPIYACLRVDNPGDWKQNPWSAQNQTLQPGETATLVTRFGYAFGRRGFALQPNKINQILIFIDKGTAQRSFRIESIQAAGTPGEKPSVSPDRIVTRLTDGFVFGPATKIDASKQIDARQAQASLVPAAQGQSLRITVTGDKEATVKLKPTAGRWSLVDFNQAVARVRNAGQTSATFAVRLNAGEGSTDPVSPAAALAPGAQADLVVPFASSTIWTGPKTGTMFNNGDVTGVSIQIPAGQKSAVIDIDSIRGTVAPLPTLPDWLGKRPPAEGNWKRTFNDDFDGADVDRARWSTEGENYWDQQRTHFSRQNVIVGNGVVKLRLSKTRGHHNDDPKRYQSDYATGYLSTYGKWTQRYGYFESRMKLPTAPGLWPAFWTMPDRGEGAANRGSTAFGGMEFDIMEYLTRYGPYHYNIAWHWDGYQKDHKSLGTERIYCQPDKDGFIVSGLLWEPGRLSFYANGQLVARWENARVASVPEHMMYTLPCGGWGGNELDDTGLPDDFVIDWVRVWQREDMAKLP